MKKQEIINVLEQRKVRSAWSQGVLSYALELLENEETNLDDLTVDETEKVLLNGAKDWQQFSYGGCFNIYDEDIAKSLCTPSELKRKKNGELSPNKHETWLDVQARALYQAMRLIKLVIKEDK